MKNSNVSTPTTNLKAAILNKLLSPSAATAYLFDCPNDVARYLQAVETVQTVQGKGNICGDVWQMFTDSREAKKPAIFVSWLDSQLPDSQKGNITGINILTVIANVGKRSIGQSDNEELKGISDKDEKKLAKASFVNRNEIGLNALSEFLNPTNVTTAKASTKTAKA
jgi:hypothetical protein